jgi:hypothetical protein
MNAVRVLLVAGTCLLTIAALTGFVQERFRDRPQSFAEWRVVHAGGTAGAVQLLALAAVWDRLAVAGNPSMLLASTLAVVAWAFFLGPLARALGRQRLARVINLAGAILAVPGYLALPFTAL